MAAGLITSWREMADVSGRGFPSKVMTGIFCPAFAHAKIPLFFKRKQSAAQTVFPLFHGVLMSSSDLCCGGNGPRDPILGLNETFNADTRSTKGQTWRWRLF